MKKTADLKMHLWQLSKPSKTKPKGLSIARPCHMCTAPGIYYTILYIEGEKNYVCCERNPHYQCRQEEGPGF